MEFSSVSLLILLYFIIPEKLSRVVVLFRSTNNSHEILKHRKTGVVSQSYPGLTPSTTK